MSIDFAKILWDRYRIKYGTKDSYCEYPRRYKTRGIRINCYTKQREIIDLEFSIYTRDGVSWLQIEKGGVTGYESVRLDTLQGDTRDWYACAGCDKCWDTLIIKEKDIKLLLNDINTP